MFHVVFISNDKSGDHSDHSICYICLQKHVDIMTIVDSMTIVDD